MNAADELLAAAESLRTTGYRFSATTAGVIVTGVALDVCVSHAVLGFSVRDYWVAVPMDCTASRTEDAEVVAYQHFMHSAYEYNLALTRSDLIELRPGVGAPQLASATAGVS